MLGGGKRGFWRPDTHFEVVYVCEEEEDEAEGRDPLAYSAGQVEDVVLKKRARKSRVLHMCKASQCNNAILPRAENYSISPSELNSSCLWIKAIRDEVVFLLWWWQSDLFFKVVVQRRLFHQEEKDDGWVIN